MDLNEYRASIISEIKSVASECGTEETDEFVDYSLQIMSDSDEISTPIKLSMPDTRGVSQKLMRADGYSYDETDHSLILFIGDYDGQPTAASLIMSRIDELYWRLFNYLEASCTGKIDEYCDPESDAVRIARLIRHGMNSVVDDPDNIFKIRFCIITDKELDTKLLEKDLLSSPKPGRKKKKTTRKKIKKEEFLGRPLDIEVWSVDRLFELAVSNSVQPVEIDIREDFDADPIPCLKGNIGSALEYDAYLAIIPGKLLADIYIEYGSRLLEGNVRAFLGTSSAKGVNNGIKRTINNAPDKFFTYNNGIAATAADIELETIDGQLCITDITDFQIINGGQTTATLAEAVIKKSNPELKGIYVPMKLTVIRDRVSMDEDGTLFYDKMVHDIAKYANSQNKVTAADLFSNDPFHIWMEKCSKKLLAPPVHYPIQTGWYYERSRKKYQQEQFKLHGDALKRFLAKFPKKQIVNKEQLAVCLTALAVKPHIVSKGKNWVMKEFGASIYQDYKKNRDTFNEYYFRRCICAVILYRYIDAYLEENKKDPDFWYKPGGYKSNIIPYTIAKIMQSIPAGYTIDWEWVWKHQTVSLALKKEIETVTYLANEYFCRNQGVLVSEYCKKESTWIGFRDEVLYEISDDFKAELIPLVQEKERVSSAKKEQKAIGDLEAVSLVIGAGDQYWLNLLNAGGNHNLLSQAEKHHLYLAASMAKKGEIPCTSSGSVPKGVMLTVQTARAVEERLIAEGIQPETGSIKLTLTDYVLH